MPWVSIDLKAETAARHVVQRCDHSTRGTMHTAATTFAGETRLYAATRPYRSLRKISYERLRVWQRRQQDPIDDWPFAKCTIGAALLSEIDTTREESGPYRDQRIRH